jgi:hypothetical protein
LEERSKELFLCQWFYSHISEICSIFRREATNLNCFNVDDFKKWSKERGIRDASFRLLHEFIFRYVLAIKKHHEGVRFNNIEMKRISKAHFESLWYIERHPNYAKINILECHGR